MMKDLIYGLHTVHTVLETNPTHILELFLLETRKDKRIRKIIDLAARCRIPVHFISRQDLERLVGVERHQGVVACLHQEKAKQAPDLEQILERETEPFLLILDHLEDPHNLGACFRVADAAGVHAIIMPKDRAVGVTSVVRKVASGAVESVPYVQVVNIARTIRKLQDKGILVIGAAGEAGMSLFEADLKGPLAIVMGSEGAGLRRLTKEYCDLLLHIPMLGTVSSLNVSVATGIFLFEGVRQRLTRG